MYFTLEKIDNIILNELFDTKFLNVYYFRLNLVIGSMCNVVNSIEKIYVLMKFANKLDIHNPALRNFMDLHCLIL